MARHGGWPPPIGRILVLVALLACKGGREMREPPATASSTPAAGASARVWYQGGTLHRATASAWRKGSPEDKLATCADLMATAWINSRLAQPKPKFAGVKSLDDLRGPAQELMAAFDQALATAGDDRTVSGTAPELLQKLGYK